MNQAGRSKAAGTVVLGEPVEFDEHGVPRWSMAMPLKPGDSQAGYPVPYVNPFLSVARPRQWPYGHFLRQTYVWAVWIPTELPCAILLSLISLGSATPSGWFVRQIQKVAFKVSAFDDMGGHEPVEVPVIFPGRVLATPVDAGMVAPVIVLNAMGIETDYCCEGHAKGYSIAYICLKPGHQFPSCMYQALTDHGVGHEERTFDDQRTAIYSLVQEQNEAFSSVLRAWAREKAVQVL